MKTIDITCKIPEWVVIDMINLGLSCDSPNPYSGWVRFVQKPKISDEALREKSSYGELVMNRGNRLTIAHDPFPEHDIAGSCSTLGPIAIKRALSIMARVMPSSFAGMVAGIEPSPYASDMLIKLALFGKIF